MPEYARSLPPVPPLPGDIEPWSGLLSSLLRFYRLVERSEDGLELSLACGHKIQLASPAPEDLRYLICSECLRDRIHRNPREFLANDAVQEAHRKRHLDLHYAYDELMADYLAHHPMVPPSGVHLLELLQWSQAQTAAPSELEHKTGHRYYFSRDFSG